MEVRNGVEGGEDVVCRDGRVWECIKGGEGEERRGWMRTERSC